MLARCTTQVLTANGGEAALRDACLRISLDYSGEKAPPIGPKATQTDVTVRGALDALSGILRRADADPTERSGGARAAAWFVRS